MVAAVWSTAPTQAGDYPARYLFSFLDNHGMLSVTCTPHLVHRRRGVRTLRRARCEESDERADLIPGTTACGGWTAVSRSAPRPATPSVSTQAVIATHPTQALGMLAEATPYRAGTARRHRLHRSTPTLLHTDTSLLPAAPRAQASWNYSLPYV